MKLTTAAIRLSPVVIALIVSLGCEPATPPEENGDSDNGAAANDDHGHSHGHSHSHEDLGPHGGHVVHLSGGMPAEWIHDDETNTVTVVLLDDDESSAISVPGATVEFVCQVEDEEPTTFVLPKIPDDALDSVLTDSRFQIQDAQLLTFLTFGEVVTCTLKVTVGEEVHSRVLEHHDH